MSEEFATSNESSEGVLGHEFRKGPPLSGYQSPCPLFAFSPESWVSLTLLAGIFLQYFTMWVHSASLPPVFSSSETPPAILPTIHDDVPHNSSQSTGTDVDDNGESNNGALHRVRRSSTRCRRQTADALQKMLQELAGRNTMYMDHSPDNFANLLSFPSNQTTQSKRRLRKRDIEALLREGHHPDIPADIQQQIHHSFITPEQKRSPRTIRSIGGEETSTIGYCERNDSPNGEGYLQLCTSCIVTTELSEDYFPRYINEVACDATRAEGCLMGSGRCVERTFEMSMLRRTDECARAQDESGQYFEQWEIVPRRVRVGCECELNAFSPLASFLMT
ncbi:uncharacterized protein [Diadema antillarum]|uniref:uncharacterized protein n=1 Tax=Diadema antillarum TaxID=105358 RepID=UPI003A868E5F